MINVDYPKFDYVELACVTKSDQFHGELVTQVDFNDAMQAAILALSRLDQIKKAFFYGKPSPQNYRSQIRCNNIHELVDVDILHCALGKATEAGEMLEHLMEVLTKGKMFDPVNFAEEMFDGQWYDAIACKKLGITFEQGQRKNIEKLQNKFAGRYKDAGFTVDAAINRDLEAERKILES